MRRRFQRWPVLMAAWLDVPARSDNVYRLGDALTSLADRAAPGGGRTGEAVQVGPGAVVLARVRVREVHVRVRRAHQHCHRPLVGSSLLEVRLSKRPVSA